MAHRVPARLTAAEGRKFALTVGIAFLALAAILVWRDHRIAGAIAAGLGATLTVAGVVVPAHLGPTYRAWMGLALLISKVTTPILMGVVYFIVMTPIGLVRRTFGKSPLAPRGGQSLWVSREHRMRGNLARQF